MTKIVKETSTPASNFLCDDPKGGRRRVCDWPGAVYQWHIENPGQEFTEAAAVLLYSKLAGIPVTSLKSRPAEER